MKTSNEIAEKLLESDLLEGGYFDKKNIIGNSKEPEKGYFDSSVIDDEYEFQFLARLAKELDDENAFDLLIKNAEEYIANKSIAEYPEYDSTNWFYNFVYKERVSLNEICAFDEMDVVFKSVQKPAPEPEPNAKSNAPDTSAPVFEKGKVHIPYEINFKPTPLGFKVYEIKSEQPSLFAEKRGDEYLLSKDKLFEAPYLRQLAQMANETTEPSSDIAVLMPSSVQKKDAKAKEEFLTMMVSALEAVGVDKARIDTSLYFGIPPNPKHDSAPNSDSPPPPPPNGGGGSAKAKAETETETEEERFLRNNETYHNGGYFRFKDYLGDEVNAVLDQMEILNQHVTYDSFNTFCAENGISSVVAEGEYNKKSYITFKLNPNEKPCVIVSDKMNAVFQRPYPMNEIKGVTEKIAVCNKLAKEATSSNIANEVDKVKVATEQVNAAKVDAVENSVDKPLANDKPLNNDKSHKIVAGTVKGGLHF